MANVDPIPLEIVRARLDGIVREMEVAVFRWLGGNQTSER